MKKRISKFVPFWVKLFIAMCLYRIFQLRMIFEKKVPKVNDFEHTVNYIIKNGVSVSRFGDGEFKWMFQNREDGNFEINSPALSNALKNTLNKRSKNLMVCIPDVFSGLSQYNEEAKEYWGICLGLNGVSWVRKLDNSKSYFDTQFTRPYMDYKDKRNAGNKFQALKLIWKDRDVLVVEGTKSRFGVGNDLLSNTRSVKRILAPSTNAFEKIDDIRNKILQETSNGDVLVLLSLGPTATVLAAELSEKNIQSIDIGHVDIEYSWYLMGATEKVPVAGKYVNEVPNGGHEVNEISNQDLNNKYHSEVVSIISK